tara:strand:+ start:621 stop:878 length:258 start_codon:yes stop_codon:yes gene_type:complete
MPIWLEIVLAWSALSIVVHLILFIIGRKNGYFKWIDDMYTDSIYNKGYKDGQASSIEEVEISTVSSSITSNSKMREYGIKDNRYI